MEITAHCLRLLMFVTVLLSAHIQKSYSQKDAFRITVDRLQFFEYESVSFRCEALDGSTQLRVNNTELNAICGVERSTLNCIIKEIYVSDSGVYWCETGGGEKSNTVNISVTAGSLILKSPAVPVMEGDNVILHCWDKTKSTNLHTYFLKNDVLLNNSPTEEMTIKNVSKSDEGLYKCSIPDVGASPGSWLTVRENHHSHHHSPDVLVPLWITILLMALLLLLVGLLYIRKHRAVLCFSSKMPTAATHSEEIDQIIPGGDSADNPNTLTYAVAFTKKRKNKDAAGAADTTSLHLERTHSRKPQGERDEDGPVYSTLNIKRISKKGGEAPPSTMCTRQEATS